MAAGPPSVERGLLDTSIFIAREASRPLGALPETGAISVVTIAELHLGVLMAQDSATRARRLRTLTAVQNAFEPLPIDAQVAQGSQSLLLRHGAAAGVRRLWTPG
jgi:predicted nucleic acid-binding protein